MKKQFTSLPQPTHSHNASGWLKLWAELHRPVPPIAHPIPKLVLPPRRSSHPALQRLIHFNASTLQRFNGRIPLCNLVTLVTLATTLLVTGCSATRPLKGGRALTTPKPAGGLEQTITQGENPAQATKQDQQTIKVRTYTLPAGSRIESSPVHSPSTFPTPHSALPTPSAPSSILYPPSSTFVLSAPVPVTEREETRANTELGPAQKDTARELGAKLSSLKSVVWVGLALFIFGLASLFYPPLRAIINSVTTSLALIAGGLALMVLPSLIVGNELLLLAGVVVVIGSWFLAHRHGQLRGSLQPQPVPVRLAPKNIPNTNN